MQSIRTDSKQGQGKRNSLKLNTADPLAQKPNKKTLRSIATG